jgi:hypothetical protein
VLSLMNFLMQEKCLAWQLKPSKNHFIIDLFWFIISLFSKILPVKEGCKSWLLVDRTKSTDERKSVVLGGFLLLPFLPKIRKLVRVLHQFPLGSQQYRRMLRYSYVYNLFIAKFG